MPPATGPSTPPPPSDPVPGADGPGHPGTPAAGEGAWGQRPGFAPPLPPAPERSGPRDSRLAELVPERTLRRLELSVTRRLDGLLNGEHLGLLPGPGTELAEARLYQPGEDDVRHMDWAVTARTTTPHVRDLIADHELEVWALADLTPSMGFGTARMVKRDLAVAALAAVGFLTVRLGDRVGAYLLDRDRLRRRPARTGKAALYALLQDVLDTDPHRPEAARPGGTIGLAGALREAVPGSAPGTLSGVLPGGVRPDLAAGIAALHRGQTRRGLRVIISDFLPDAAFTGPAAAEAGSGRGRGRGRRGDAAPVPDMAPGELPWERPLRRLAARHQVLAVEIIDPRELDLPDIGPVVMTDPETGATQEIHLSRKVRERYAAAAREQREATRAALRRAGAHHLVLRTDRDWVTDIARFALRRRRSAGRAAGPAGGGSSSAGSSVAGSSFASAPSTGGTSAGDHA
ncbi:DUF58 domain-containing protein [Actinomadura harenae]|uniref:DUF58 domain-containing protein n=1 Tax=Actinomadura harenae TaxID=2483351 RepID=A0A3M2M3G7_9ACTN|nr:DUF58 domain-containing protein [Actinomadura harenae]RMI43353.1 DUF58 domain-containing protein [Actinomadura harenae]